ncbi:mobilization protein [Muricauda oceani]|uniref:Mobilization protein n=1 Tax=Flagellimonas oceani TaxID=2698672 RepID=A0A6G7J2J1_9FLAO|nr:MobB family relaxase [Allomuricauda oceani]MBW8244119.1 mobilization protein [Allomuricauda oceani]QII45091.1 mobilization protein [Allomuricauda oceani]
MYITITRQHLGETFSQSSADFVNYLEKENKALSPEQQEPFFNQQQDHIDPKTVVQEIDANTDRLKQSEPKFYSLTINPSQRELAAIQNDPEKLKAYVREIMKDYAASFYRKEPVQVEQLKYFAKIEKERTYSGRDREIRENRPYRAQIAKLQNDLAKVNRGALQGNPKHIQRDIDRLYKQMPHKLDGKPITAGMQKPGSQTHVHIVMSRKDVTNTYSLSPGSSYRESEVQLHGKTVKRGFRRDQFFDKAEKTFDRMFKYNRNYVESYKARKTLDKDPKAYFSKIMGLPASKRAVALKLLSKTGAKVPLPNIPTSKVAIARKTIARLQKAAALARKASSIEI